MIQLKHKNNSIRVPQMWSEITLKQWIDVTVCGEDQVKIVSVLTGLPEAVVTRISQQSADRITASLQFISKQFETTNWVVPKVLKIGEFTIDANIDIKEKEYGQKIMLQDAVLQEGGFINNLLTIVEIYLQTLLSKKFYDIEKTEEFKALIYKDILLCDAYAIGINLIKQLDQVLKRESEELKVPPTKEEVAAGINEYNRFGIMNTIRALANGDVLKTDEVLRKNYNEVFLWLLMKKQDGIFEKRYREILNNSTPNK